MRISPRLAASAGFLGTATMMAVPALAAPKAPSPSTVAVSLYGKPTTLNPRIPQAWVANGEPGPNLFVQVPTGTLKPDLAEVVSTVANGGISRNGLNATRKEATE